MSLTNQNNPDGSRRHKLLMRLGHYSRLPRTLTFIGLIITFYLPGGSFQRNALFYCSFILMLLSVGGGLYHDRRLCTRCFDELRLDAAAAAHTRRPLLWLAHRWVLLFGLLYPLMAAIFIFIVLDLTLPTQIASTRP